MDASLAKTVLAAILAGGGAWSLFAFLLGRRGIAANVPPGELKRMMRRYGIDALDPGSVGVTEEFIRACHNCMACDRKAQCREWLERSLPGDIPLFCSSEAFFTRVRHAKICNPRLSHPCSLPNHLKY